ncbi:MAG TPA: tRNA glutamyl-Q(34) synthetase GluQRS, partial [Rhodospirillales bacterium]|nr:tRNA glutamyl-Q(34) synthetase GluQRS [Rhodospirillales bacterium]
MPLANLITRFAPSPTGHLHLGHALAALFAARAAKQAGGRFLLRIEDIDATRCRQAFEKAIHEDLRWLELQWESPVRRQSEHMNDYAAALDKLAALDVLYPCFCTRKEIRVEIAAAGNAPHGPDGHLYPGTCRGIDKQVREERVKTGLSYALRLDVEKATALTGELDWSDAEAGAVAAKPHIFGDVVLARKDTPTSYHLAATLDDHLQGVSLVTRGEDLFPATHIHRLLQALLDLDRP